MYQTNYTPFDLAKQKISESSNKIAKLLIWVIVLAIITVIVAAIVFFVAISSIGGTIDPTNPYTALSALFGTAVGGAFLAE